jgi:hypothetical protein
MIPVGGLAIKLFYPDGAKLTDLIGTAAYFPAAALADPVNFDLTQAEILTAYDRTRPKNGRWLVPLPHPSGASLWPNRPANQQLINQAVQLLKQIRLDWGL